MGERLIRLGRRPSGQLVVELVILMAAAMLVITSCAWLFDDGGDVVTDAGADDGSAAGPSVDENENDDDGNGDDEGDEAAALQIIRDAAQDSGVADEQRAGTVSVFLSVSLRCAEAEASDFNELELAFPAQLSLCLEPDDDFWQLELFGPDGNRHATSWHHSGLIIHRFLVSDPWGTYSFIATNRGGGRVEGQFEFGRFPSLVLEAAEADDQPALAIAGYGDETEMLLAAYDATGVEPFPAGVSGVVYNAQLDHLTDLGPVELDPSGRTILPIESDVEQFCIYPLDPDQDEQRVHSPFSCFGESPGPPTASPGTDDLSRALAVETNRSDLGIAVPIETTLQDGSVITLATVTELEDGRPVGAVAFVEGAADNQVNAHGWVESEDFVSAWNAVCRLVKNDFALPRDPCRNTVLVPEWVFIRDRLEIDTGRLVTPVQPEIPVVEFDYVITIDPDLILDSDLRLNLPDDLRQPGDFGSPIDPDDS